MPAWSVVSRGVRFRSHTPVIEWATLSRQNRRYRVCPEGFLIWAPSASVSLASSTAGTHIPRLPSRHPIQVYPEPLDCTASHTRRWAKQN
jgi:hypothetical protein